jgi:hypothetical protein
VHVHRRELFLDRTEQRCVPLQREGRVHPSLHKHLSAADLDQSRDLLVQRFVTERVRIRLIAVAPKCAEGALGGADVGVVDVPVDHVGPDVVAMHLPAPRIRPAAEAVQWHGAKQSQPLIGGQSRVTGNDRGQQARVSRFQSLMLRRSGERGGHRLWFLHGSGGFKAV